MLFSLLEYLQMLKHMENIWEKKCKLISHNERRGGGVFFFTDPKCMGGVGGGGQGEFSVSFEEIFSSQGCKQL